MEEKTGKEEIIADEGGAGSRLDVFLVRNHSNLSRSQIQKLIERQQVLVNDEPCQPKTRLQLLDRVSFTDALQVPEVQRLTPRPLPLDILFEDDDLIVINKAAGVVVHPGAGSHDVTLVEGLLHHVDCHQLEDGLRPGVVHRLDKDTSGVIVWAKNTFTLGLLARQFQEKTNLRQYFCLMQGDLADEVTVSSYLNRDPRNPLKQTSITESDYLLLPEAKRTTWRLSKTHFRVHKRYIDQNSNVTLNLVEAQLETGRTHQIRVHAQSINAAVVGDRVYGWKPRGFPSLPAINRQLLHAASLGFIHPRTQQAVAFEADLPEDFRAVLDELNQVATKIPRSLLL